MVPENEVSLGASLDPYGETLDEWRDRIGCLISIICTHMTCSRALAGALKALKKIPTRPVRGPCLTGLCNRGGRHGRVRCGPGPLGEGRARAPPHPA